MSLYLSRLTLNNKASAKALIQLLNPTDLSKAADSHHRLIWTVFSDSNERVRDFLWRYDGKGRFMVLSARPPAASELFLPHEIKPFTPKLCPGDRLHYLLRANATRSLKQDSGRGKRVDIVMDLLHNIPKGTDRALSRPKLANEAAAAWMGTQGATKGFQSIKSEVEGYTTLELGRKRREGATLGVLDLNGILEISDPDCFLTALAQGFGRAKAWGCGLMLIRRVR